MISDERSFGILIAFIIPGWIGLLGLSYIYPLFDVWLAGSVKDSPTVGGFLFALLASAALGTGFSTIRWLIVDPLVGLTTKKTARPTFENLKNAHEVLRLLIESHYRFYQFHGNVMVAAIIAMLCRWYVIGFSGPECTLLGLVLVLLFLGARDTKVKYDRQTVELMLTNENVEMTNAIAQHAVLGEEATDPASQKSIPEGFPPQSSNSSSETMNASQCQLQTPSQNVQAPCRLHGKSF